MNISQYFEPAGNDVQTFLSEISATTIGNKIVAYTPEKGFPEVEEGSLAILGITDDRGAVGNRGCGTSANQVRSYLYGLAMPVKEMNLYDLGNVIAGESLEDTYFAVTDVLKQLIEHNVTVLVIGGGQDMTYAMYKAYELAGRVINICAIDPRFDISEAAAINSRSYLNHIIMQQPNYMFNFTTIGYQTYLVGNGYIHLMDELNFDPYRLGYIQEDMRRAEPLIRNADLVSIDINAVRQSDAPAHAHPSPHGFYGEQMCQMARFAGMSDKVSSLGLFELNPVYDNEGQTAQMAAHALWYFIEGFYNRKSDHPYIDKQNYKQYIVQMESHDLTINFYKSRLSDRWWMEVPCNNEELKQRYMRHLLIPCNYSDYERAMQNEVPELWWRYYQRLQW